MLPGDILDGRFRIEAHVASGAMGAVYRATDLVQGGAVAVKVMTASVEDHAAWARFSREASTLASVRHPAIVGFVWRGQHDAHPYLVMEWLEGETLEERLTRSSLSPRGAVELTARLARALAQCHVAGVVHRDVKPANVMLVGGALERAALVDFGIARALSATRVTETGGIVGTFPYASPEQALGLDVAAPTDVFSLGCVLFECLTGDRLFPGGLETIVLARIASASAPAVSKLVPDLPEELDELLARMLAKDPARRILAVDVVGDVERMLSKVALSADARPGRAAPDSRVASASYAPLRRGPRLTLMLNEQRLAWVVLVGAAEVGAGAMSPPTTAAISRSCKRYGGRPHFLASGVTFVLFEPSGVASDDALRAARCALALRVYAGHAAPVSIAAGPLLLAQPLPDGDALDEAHALLRAPPASGVRIDDESATLLSTRAVLERDEHGTVLVDLLRASHKSAHRAELFGRARETQVLHGWMLGTLDDSRSGLFVVSGPPGIGKSRLLEACLERLRGALPDVRVLAVGGDPMALDASFRMLREVVGSTFTDRAADSAAARKMLQDGALALVKPERRSTIADALAPMWGPATLRGQRDEAEQMAAGDRVRWAFIEWLRVTTTGPTLIVIEDVHWVDQASFQTLRAALRELSDRPCVVVATGRPELERRFEDMDADHHLRLAPLRERAARDLVRALAPGASEELVETVLERAEGNPLFLEELVGRGGGASAPELPRTVLGAIQTRLDELDAPGRRMLRAASVFGRVFWAEGVRAVLGGRGRDDLEDLVVRGYVRRRNESRYHGASELEFRHAIIRDVVYATLPPNDAALAHGNAAKWLEVVGERDHVVLAEHWERSGRPDRASLHFVRAAENALEGAHPETVEELARSARRAGASGELALDLDIARAAAFRASGRHAESLSLARAVLAGSKIGTARWAAATGLCASESLKAGALDVLAEVTSGVRAALPSPTLHVLRAAMIVARACCQTGDRKRVAVLYEPLREMRPSGGWEDGEIEGHWLQCETWRAYVDRDDERAVMHNLRSADCFERAGVWRSAISAEHNAGFTLIRMGAYAMARERLADVLITAGRIGLVGIIPMTRANMGNALAGMGLTEEALAQFPLAIDAARRAGDKRCEAVARMYRALVLARLTRWEDAAIEAEASCAVFGSKFSARAVPLTTLAEAGLAAGDVPLAEARCREAVGILEAEGWLDFGEAYVRRVQLEIALASGDVDRARSLGAGWVSAFERRSSEIADPALLASWTAMHDHVLLRAHVASLLGA